MANSTSHVLPYPIKNARFSLELVFRVAAGTPTDPTGPDTEFSSDGGATFTDCAEEITTGGANGVGYLTLSGAETNVNLLAIAAKSSNCLTTPAILYPRVLASVGTGTLSAGSAGGGTLGTLLAYDVTGCFIMTTGGTGGGGTGGANNQARRIVTYNVTTGAFTVTPNWETTPDATTTYNVLLPEGVTLGMLKTLNPTTPGQTLLVEASTGLVGISANGITATSIADAAIDRTTFAVDTGLRTIRSSTAQGGSSGAILLDASASATDDFYTGLVVLITGGLGIGQARVIRGYAGTSKSAGVSPNWTTNPDNTSTFAILPAGDINSVVSDVKGNVVGNVQGNLLGSATSIGAGGIIAASFGAGAIDAAALATDAVAEIAAGILDLSAGVETGLTPRQALRLISAALAGKISGAGTTTVVIRNAVADSKPRITATVDSSGNRSALTIDVS